jgi:uncharacterized GH25 family protein
MRHRLQFWMTVAVLVLGAGSASAHEFWLAPSSYGAGPRDTLTLRAFVGTGFRGEMKPYATPRTVRFTRDGHERVDLAPGVTNGELRWAVLIPPDDGGQLVVYQSSFIPIELPADRFDSYLATEGLDEALATRRRLGAKAGTGRERYIRCAKTWVRGNDPQRALRRQGLPLEIVPLADPDGASSRLTVLVLERGKPLAGALVRAWNRPLAREWTPFDGAVRDSVAPAEERRTAHDGTVVLDVSRPGEWLLNVIHMEPSRDRREADWESAWASFTFARGQHRR